MYTIKVIESEIYERLEKGRPEYYQTFEEFIFDEYKLILRMDVTGENDKQILWVKREPNQRYSVKCRVFKHGTYKDGYFVFVGYDNEKFDVLECSGKLFDDMKRMLKSNGESKYKPEIEQMAKDSASPWGAIICTIEDYIMNESLFRKKVTKTIEVKEKTSSEASKAPKKEKKPVKKQEIFLLEDLVTYISNNRRQFKIECPRWGVRGHFRRYKNGKVVWIAPFEKGKYRNDTTVEMQEKVYTV